MVHNRSYCRAASARITAETGIMLHYNMHKKCIVIVYKFVLHIPRARAGFEAVWCRQLPNQLSIRERTSRVSANPHKGVGSAYIRAERDSRLQSKTTRVINHYLGKNNCNLQNYTAVKAAADIMARLGIRDLCAFIYLFCILLTGSAQATGK